MENETLIHRDTTSISENVEARKTIMNIQGIETLTNPVVFIFDRYGKLLKQLAPNSVWDGTFNGQQMPSTDYWFRFEYGEIEEGLLVAKTRKTHFTLKR